MCSWQSISIAAPSHTLSQTPEPASEAKQPQKPHRPTSKTKSNHKVSNESTHNRVSQGTTYNIPNLTTPTTENRPLRPRRSNNFPHPVLEDSRPVPLSRPSSSTRLRCSWRQTAIATRITSTRKSRGRLSAVLTQDFRAVSPPRMPGARVRGRRERHAVYDLRRGEGEAQVLQDFDDVRWGGWRCSSRRWCILLFFCAFTSCRLVSLLSADLLAHRLAIMIKPFRKPLFQHQASRRQSVLVRGADRAASLSRRVCIGGQRGDERVEDVLLEGDDGRAVGAVVWESDLEAQDGVCVWSWWGRKM
jgi:hypothetical protein